MSRAIFVAAKGPSWAYLSQGPRNVLGDENGRDGKHDGEHYLLMMIIAKIP